MNIGVFGHGWWEEACERLSHEVVSLPVAEHPSGNAHAADLAGRLQTGTAAVARLADRPVDILVDQGGTGLGFSRGSSGSDDLKLAHDAAGKVLLSHFVAPLPSTFRGLDWQVMWQCLQSSRWGKAVWDRAQATELQQFGVPCVVHLPMAAMDRSYNTQPLDPAKTKPIVSFVGEQNTAYFAGNNSIPSRDLLAGILAQSIRADIPGTPFYDVYHEIYGLGEPPCEGDDAQTRANKAFAYFGAKLFFNASQCIRNRDRFVIYLRRKLPSQFQLIGTGWDTTYGLPATPPLETAGACANHFREVAVNLNLVDGDAETGLNMRHFEITASGGFMLCYDQPELAEHFEVGKECDVFRNERELLDKIQYYLSHSDERIAIARAGQERTLSHHLCSHRLQTLLRMVQSDSPPVDYSTSNMWDDSKSLVPEADMVLDCGANTGQMARGYRNAYPTAEIFSFEPVSSVFEQLRETCDNVGAHPVKKAVGDHDGQAMINLTASPEANSLLDFQEGNPCAKWTRVVGRESIEVCTLDRWCDENEIDPRRIDIVKLDVQGSELAALRGATKVLEAARLVYLEVSFVPMYLDCPLFGDIDTFLTSRGYRRHAVYPSDQPRHWGDALYVRV